MAVKTKQVAQAVGETVNKQIAEAVQAAVKGAALIPSFDPKAYGDNKAVAHVLARSLSQAMFDAGLNPYAIKKALEDGFQGVVHDTMKANGESPGMPLGLPLMAE